MNSFENIGLIEPLQRAIAEANYSHMTPIQAEAIPPLLDGKDVMGCAQTGTGKTAAFLLPIIQKIMTSTRPKRWGIRALILSPTRELAAQINESLAIFSKYLRLSHLVIFGGVSQKPQVELLERGVDVLVATPGRLLDLHGQGIIAFNKIEFFVLDEADCMLDMGFIHDIKKVLAKLPSKRQNLLFSATMPKPIIDFAHTFLDSPVSVEVAPQSTTAEKIQQSVMFVERPNKKRLLAHLLIESEVESAIVFTRTKHGANRVVKDLGKVGIEAVAIHGNKSQGARTRALSAFKSRTIRVLVATDIAARGIDVSKVSHVFNYDLPNVSETYVHRIGRTARAGRAGFAIAFCDESESEYLRNIERLIGQSIEIIHEHKWHYPEAIPKPRDPKQRQSRKAPPRNQRRRGSTNAPRKEGARNRPQSNTSNRVNDRDSQESGENNNPVRQDHRRRRPRRTGPATNSSR